MSGFKSFLLFLLFIVSTDVVAQRLISGTVVDQVSGEPLPGANLYLLNDWETGTSTDLNGGFSLLLKEKAQLEDTIVFSFLGFAEQLIPVKSWKNGVVRMRLKQRALAEVVVESSSLVAEEFQYEEISKLKIYTSPAAKADPLLAVNALPSATPSDESANISLRGGSTAQTGVFFNDVPIYDYVKFSQLNGIGVFSIFNTALVKNVSVFPGNPPLEYGNVSGGMVSVVSDDKVVKANTNNVTISPASFGYFRQQRISDRVMLSFFGYYQPGGILKSINGDALRGIRGFELFDAGLYLFAQLNDHSLIKVFNYSLAESYQFNF
ncbi:MAG: TonB-dependent receptor, partial [Bacteroidota bacterium]